ncbi:hypothetical protein F5Y12DRAFT_800940 [Xylaria sp. FL1777]|nr:hypothetical protein F5Y12DRAFT_800940 [Xylaria sp. FL1777]
MTDGSPKVRVAAHLDLVSPAPVHPSSPIIVPTLQNQADTYFNMSLSSNDTVKSAPATIHDSIPNNGLDTRLLNLGNADADTAVDGVSEKADVVSADISARDIKRTEPSQHNATDAEQEVPSSNKSTLDPDASALATSQFDVVASAYENNRSILHASPGLASTPYSERTTQQIHQVLKQGQVVTDPILSNTASAQLSQSPVAHSHANNNHQPTWANHPAINVQVLLDNITARAENGYVSAIHNPTSGGAPNGNVLPQGTILPPKPPTLEQAFTQPYHPTDGFPSEFAQTSSTPLPPNTIQALSAYKFAAQGIVGPGASATPIPAATVLPNHAISPSQANPINGALTVRQPLDGEKQGWDTFLQHERKYVSEARWDMFPEGSRIFIGNLSSERVTKREVFEAFSHYGRLAQISLKQAYGFVQYHTVAEGQAAMDHLQGIELGGKRINLEISRTQKKDGEGNRGSRGKRDGDRHDGNRGRRDNHRPSRQPSPRRSNHRQQPPSDNNNRERIHQETSYSSDRRRSQSPRYNGYESYRRRSASPYRRHMPASNSDLPPPYGTEVPDVHFLLEDVSHDFVAWVQHEFTREHLRFETRPLSPGSSPHEVIQYLVFHGAQAIVLLDIRAQRHGKISLQLFDRSDDSRNVRYDHYQDLHPTVAAQLITTRRPHIPPPYHSSQHSPAQYPSAYTPSYAQTYHSPVAPDAGDSLRNPAVVDTLLASLGGPYRASGGHPPSHHNMGYMHTPPNLPSGAAHAGNSTVLQDIFAQLSRARQ